MITLNDNQLKNAKVLRNRYSILNFLPKNATVAEVGVLGGDFSAHILKTTNPKKLVLIDTFESNDYPHEKRFTAKTHFNYINAKFELESERVEVLKGLSWICLSQFEDNYFDWIYVDAAHDYDSVKKDLDQVLKKLKPNGIIVMNDYIMYDHYTKENYGVVQATNEFMKEHNFEMLYFALHPDMFCECLPSKE